MRNDRVVSQNGQLQADLPEEFQVGARIPIKRVFWDPAKAMKPLQPCA
jgi:hypothetical protein